jgi:hypothetical protein
VLGLGSLLAVARRSLRTPADRAVARAALVRTLRAPASAALAILALYLVLRMAWNPLTKWDARSIWLFHAHRLWEHGHLVAAEVVGPWVRFSHPDYPLFLPAWMSHFASLADGFDERLAGIGASLLGLTLLSILARLLAARTGPRVAALLTLGLLLELDHVLLSGYGDAPLVLLLAIEFLALTTRGERGLGLLAAACASLVKLEGLPLAALVLVVALAPDALRPVRRWAWALLAFVPAVVHVLWTRGIGLESVDRGRGVAEVLAELPERLGQALDEAPQLLTEPGYTQVRALLALGLAAGLLVPLVLLVARPTDVRAVVKAWVAAGLATAAAFLAMTVTPDPVPWLVDTALDRLLLHGSVLALLALFLALGPVASSTPRLPVRATPLQPRAARELSTTT